LAAVAAGSDFVPVRAAAGIGLGGTALRFIIIIEFNWRYAGFFNCWSEINMDSSALYIVFNNNNESSEDDVTGFR
jgi:hypothetical protein